MFFCQDSPSVEFANVFHRQRFTLCICNQLLECDNALWLRVYNKIINIPMGSCRIIICIPMGSCTTFHIIVVTHTQVHCLTCTHKPKRPKVSTDISGNVRVPVLHLICNTSDTLKIYLNLMLVSRHLSYYSNR